MKSSPVYNSLLLSETDGPAVEVLNPNGLSDMVLVCEHASNRIPRSLQDLGLGEVARNSHVAWDPGALALAKLLSAAFDAPLVASRISRLVYDCNRPPEARDAMPAKSEQFDIPGNHAISQSEHQARVVEVYDKFSAALTGVIARKSAQGKTPVLVTIHSFTPVYYGQHRAVEIGVLHDVDDGLATRILGAAGSLHPLKIERNQPYGPKDGVTHTLQIHGIANQIPNVMIEVRHDLLTGTQAVDDIASALQYLLQEAGLQLAHEGVA
ncbi:MAG: N-formylglutamate amidohydrolase [Alphaproteobacteria bacterium]|nr:N-formylglutamate amidohydrolase [Alphaproteobacteria bacterium]